MLDQRRTARTGMIQDARIVLGDVIVHCAALDLSSTGARVCFFIPFVGPELMTLRLPDGQVLAARRRWQQGAQMGVEFLPADDATAHTSAYIGLVGQHRSSWRSGPSSRVRPPCT